MNKEPGGTTGHVKLPIADAANPYKFTIFPMSSVTKDKNSLLMSLRPQWRAYGRWAMVRWLGHSRDLMNFGVVQNNANEVATEERQGDRAALPAQVSNSYSGCRWVRMDRNGVRIIFLPGQSRATHSLRLPVDGNGRESGAVGENRTHDLSLTKG